MDGAIKDVNISCDGEMKVGNTVNLNINMSDLSINDGNVIIALPNSLRLSSTFANEEGLYLSKNSTGSVNLSFNEHYKKDVISIPLYVVLDGNFEIEPIIIKYDNQYHISNNLVVDINK